MGGGGTGLGTSAGCCRSRGSGLGFMGKDAMMSALLWRWDRSSLGGEEGERGVQDSAIRERERARDRQVYDFIGPVYTC